VCPWLKTIDEHFPARITAWMEKPAPEKFTLQQDTSYIVQQVMHTAKQLIPLKEENDTSMQNALAVI